jgi:hypothetical protein
MRHVLKTINRFEFPEQSLEDFLSQDDVLDSCPSLHNLMHDGSHGIIRWDGPQLEDQIKNGCETIINFLSNKYKGQIDHIESTI